MWCAFAVVALAAPPSPSPNVAVVVTRRTNVSLPEAKALAAQVALALAEAGLPQSLMPDAAVARLGVKDTGACQGRQVCTLEFARQLGLDAVVAVSLARVQGELAIGVELIRAGDGAALAVDSVLIAPKARPSAQAFEIFAAAAQRTLAPEPPPVDPPPPAPPLPAPPPPALTPPPPAAEPPSRVDLPAAPSLEQPAPRSRVGPAVLLAVGGAALIAGQVLAVLAGISSSDLHRSEQRGTEQVSVHTYERAATLAGDINALATGALLSGVLALAAVGLAWVLW